MGLWNPLEKREREKHPERYGAAGSRLKGREVYRSAVVASHLEKAAKATERGASVYTAVIGAADSGSVGGIIDALSQAGWVYDTSVPGGLRTSLIFRRTTSH